MYWRNMLQCKEKDLYTGIRTDVEGRVKEHNSSKLGAKYTRARRPVKLVYSKEFESRSEALIEEARIKKLARVEKIKLFN